MSLLDLKPNTAVMNQEVTDYIGSLKHKPNQEWQADVAEEIRQLIFQAIPEAGERIQYGKPHFLKNGKYAAVISPSKEVLSVLVFNATDLVDPTGFFDPSSKPERRTWKIKKGEEIQGKVFVTLLLQAASTL